jgi:uncharacterized radical SAM superfamily protein
MLDLNNLIERAWEIRQGFEPQIWFSAPGAKHYENQYYTNQANSFVNLSVTGKACSCRCDHCDGKLLQTMVGAPNPHRMHQVIENLLDKKCQGILISGGANFKGEVPLLPFIETMAYAKKMGLKVLVHTGLINRETAFGLKQAGVDQVLIDVIGNKKTISQVYHLDQQPDDYLQSMLLCREEGLNIAPHVVIGLHYGQILGERRALEMISQADPETIVLVILTPMCGTAMEVIQPPSIDKVSEIIAETRILNPVTPITLGCARPSGQYKRKVEVEAINCGVNGMAFPDQTSVAYAQSKGLQTTFSEDCCSLIARRISRCKINEN